MNIDEIKAAVDEGKIIHWGNDNYVVIKNNGGRYKIKSKEDNSCINLSWLENPASSIREDEFFV